MFSKQLVRIIKRFYKARNDPGFFSKIAEEMTQNGFDELIDFDKCHNLRQDKEAIDKLVV